MMYSVIISCDPGVSGGISILDGQKRPKVYKMPVHNIVVNKKNKKEYDLDGIFQILSPYGEYPDVLFIQERVSSMPGEGSVSSFGFGKSAGLTIGMAVGLGFKVIEISPVTWKKGFPELITDSIAEKKQEIKDLRLQGKTLKDKQAKKQNKKHIDKLNRQIKSEAKSAARGIVSKKYSNLASQLEKKNSDGLAESLLIALYGKKYQDELV